MNSSSPPTTAPAQRPLNGAEYLASLRDGREVYLDGERVPDVTAHPGLRNAARSIARLYDDLHDPATAERLTCPTDTGRGGYTHRAFRVPRSSSELVAARGAIAGWSRRTFGWMGRTPDYKASLTNTLGARSDFYGPFTSNARAWYEHAQSHVPFISHSMVNPPVDRHKPPHEIKDVCIHAHRETDRGVIVSGAKVVATSAAISNYNFVGQTPATASDDPELALSFILPIATPGVKLFCRRSYESIAHEHGSPFDYPLSSRFDENDAIIVLDNVFIPWENVLIYRDPERTRGFFMDTGFLNGFLFHGCTRYAVKLDFLAGLLAKSLRITGGDAHRGNRALLGELLALRHTAWSLSDAMCHAPDPWPDAPAGAVLPQRQAALAYSVFAPDAYPRVRELIQQALSSALIYLPSSARDLDHPEIGPLLSRFVRGSHDTGHIERIKVMKLMWDAIGTEFGGRHELYERLYAGGRDAVRLQTAIEAERSGRLDELESLADECLSQYDPRGWTVPTWIDPAAGNLQPPHAPAADAPLHAEPKPFWNAA